MTGLPSRRGRRGRRTVRLTLAVGAGGELDFEQAATDLEWHFRLAGGGQSYEVFLPLRDNVSFTTERARGLLAACLDPRGVTFAVLHAVLLQPTHDAVVLPVYAILPTKWPRLEQLLVRLGLRDVGAAIMANSWQQADLQLNLVAMDVHSDVRVGWRRRWGQQPLPEVSELGEEPTPKSQLGEISPLKPLQIGLTLAAFGTGLGMGLTMLPATLITGMVLIALTAYGFAKLYQHRSWALAGVVAGGFGVLVGFMTRPGWSWLIAVAVVPVIWLLRKATRRSALPWGEAPSRMWFQQATRLNLIILAIAAAALVLVVVARFTLPAAAHMGPAEVAALITSGTAVMACAAAGIQSLAAWRTAQRAPRPGPLAPLTSVRQCLHEAFAALRMDKRPQPKVRKTIAEGEEAILRYVDSDPEAFRRALARSPRKAIADLMTIWERSPLHFTGRAERRTYRRYGDHLQDALDRLILEVPAIADAIPASSPPDVKKPTANGRARKPSSIRPAVFRWAPALAPHRRGDKGDDKRVSGGL